MAYRVPAVAFDTLSSSCSCHRSRQYVGIVPAKPVRPLAYRRLADQVMSVTFVDDSRFTYHHLSITRPFSNNVPLRLNLEAEKEELKTYIVHVTRI